MKRNLTSVLLVFVVSIMMTASLHAQSATLTWTPSVTPGVISQNVYRAASPAGPFSKLAAGTGLPSTTKTFTDLTVVDGSSYSYYVTAVCPTSGACVGESAPSNVVSGSVPGSAPAPPTGLSITSIVASISGKQETIVASWTDSPGALDTFTLYGTNGKVLVNGKAKSSLTWMGKTSAAISAHLVVCDSKSCQAKIVQTGVIGAPGSGLPGY